MLPNTVARVEGSAHGRDDVASSVRHYTSVAVLAPGDSNRLCLRRGVRALSRYRISTLECRGQAQSDQWHGDPWYVRRQPDIDRITTFSPAARGRHTHHGCFSA